MSQEEEEGSGDIFLADETIAAKENHFASRALSLVTNKFAENVNHSNNFLRCKSENL